MKIKKKGSFTLRQKTFTTCRILYQNKKKNLIMTSVNDCHSIGPANLQNFYDATSNRFPGLTPISAYGIVSNWLRSVVSTNTPAAFVISPLQLTSYTLPSDMDQIIEYVPVNSFQVGQCGGTFFHVANGGNVTNQLMRVNYGNIDNIVQNLSKFMMSMIRDPKMKTMGKITKTPLNHFSENYTNYTYDISTLVTDPSEMRRY